MRVGQASGSIGMISISAPLILSAAKGKDETGEVRSAAGAADDDVGLVDADHRELLLGLEPDDGLMEHDVVEDAAERVASGARGIGDRRFDGLRDGDAKAARGVGHLFENVASGLGLGRGRRHAARAPGLHHGLAEGLLVEADPHHPDVDLNAEELAGVGEGRAPLAGAGLGGQPLDAELFVVPGLGDRGVGLVAARRRHALVLVEDLGRCPEVLLEGIGAAQGRGTPTGVDLEDLLRDVDPSLGRDLLLDEIHREDRRQGLGPDRIAVGAERGRRRLREIGGEVVPLARHLTDWQFDSRFDHCCALLENSAADFIRPAD